MARNMRIDSETGLVVLVALVGALQWGLTGAAGIDLFAELGLSGSLESTLQLVVAAAAGYGLIDIGGEVL